MKIGVLSDTHLSNISGVISSVKHIFRNTRTLEDLRKLIVLSFRDVDPIIHAGDFVELTVLELLRDFAPLEAVQGNTV